MEIMETLKAVATVVKEAHRIDLYEQVLDLQQAMLNTQQERLAERGAMEAAKRRIAELEEALRLKAILAVGKNSYWIQQPDHWDGPFCPGCWDGARKACRAVQDLSGRVACPVCKAFLGYPHPPGSHDYPIATGSSG